jgi:arginase
MREESGDSRYVPRRFGVVGAPSSAGAYAPGQEGAPVALRDAGLLDELRRHGADVEDFGDTRSFRWRPDAGSPRAQNAETVVAVAREVAQLVAAVREDDRVALVLGGDCTVGLGTVAGLAARAPGPPGLVYLDLHSDLNVPGSTVDGALDWMGVAHMLGLEGTVADLAGLGADEPLLGAGDLVFLGLEEGLGTAHERDAIARLGLARVPIADLNREPGTAADRCLSHLRGQTELAVHFDVDVLDFLEIPLAENTDRNGGASLDAAAAAISRLAGDPRLAALTLTELNPAHGDRDDLATFVARLATALAG